uniref:BTB domain-containing protein n=1 Tax=Steinernema glaseri TaxID=37863 RepID=A0A1I7XXV0_9BILA
MQENRPKTRTLAFAIVDSNQFEIYDRNFTSKHSFASRGWQGRTRSEEQRAQHRKHGNTQQMAITPRWFVIPIQTVISALDVQELEHRTYDDFVTSHEDSAVLNMDDGEVPASKQVLSAYSPYFKSMFFGKFTEATSGRYVIKDVKVDEFQMFLSVIYNMDSPIASQEWLESVLRLADMWLVDVVTNRCGHVLKDAGYLDFAAKMYKEVKELRWCFQHKPDLSNFARTVLESRMAQDLRVRSPTMAHS